MTSQKSERLDVTRILAMIQPGGALAKELHSFEPRPEQQAMMREVVEAYEKPSVALIEAGTGVGKSIAYLLPAILSAAKTGTRTIISTHTITLQEQLVEKDIPLLLKALNIEMKVCLMKGMGNYLCLRKLDDALAQMPLLPAEEAEELAQIGAWRETAKDGSRSELASPCSQTTWERVSAENDTCNGHACPAYGACFFFKSRRKGQESKLIVVNHHLLLTDLVRRAEDNNYGEPAVLPPYQHIVLDEAHHLEDIATHYFATRVSQIEVSRLMTRLSADRHGKLASLKKALLDYLVKEKGNVSEELRRVLTLLELEMPAERHALIEQFIALFQALSDFAQSLKARDSEEDVRLRLREEVLKHPEWVESIHPRIQNLVQQIKKYCASLSGVQQQILHAGARPFEEQTASLRHDLQALTGRLLQVASTLEKIALEKCPEGQVRWIETFPGRGLGNVVLMEASLDLSQLFKKFLFDNFHTIILCSATLTTGQKFTFFRARLGLEEASSTKKIQELAVKSPFNYQAQALFAVPVDMPDPAHPDFFEKAVEAIWESCLASRGNALVLFTSFQMLKQCLTLLKPRLEAKGYPVLSQGEENRKTLLHQMRTKERSVLFATASFWEGVDIPGEALRCVIIVKLPFKVPTEPVFEAQTEALSATGRNAFLELAVPSAAVRFKQGCGRLIRKGTDRGCIICLDRRLVTRPYGALFLSTLPEYQRIFEAQTVVFDRMAAFYKQTYHFARAQKA